MLLIVSDSMKSLWFMLYNIVSITAHRQLKSSSTFCQVNGFFFVMGIEAADAALFLIALHSTICIFWPNRASGENGLYPYRHGAYAFFALWPILMASLAFVTGTSAYVNTGQFCYLPTRPWWYRTVLSWIPRCVNLLLILLMYGSSYFHIRGMIKRYSRRNSKVSTECPRSTVFSTSPLTAHDLIPLSSSGSIRSSTRVPSMKKVHKERTRCRPTEQLRERESSRVGLDNLYTTTRMRGIWSWIGFKSATSALLKSIPPSGGVSPCNGTAISGTADVESFAETVQMCKAPMFTELPELAILERKFPTNTSASTKPATSRGHPSLGFYHRPLAHDVEVEGYFTDLVHSDRDRAHTDSQIHIKEILQEGPLQNSDNVLDRSYPLLVLDQAIYELGGVSRARERLRRQLRYLFLYPSVYVCIWVFPFLNDLSIFIRSLQKHPPYWLTLCSLISLSIQGLVDSLVFCAREKPWRHLRDGFWRSLGLDVLETWKFALRKDSGRTREEMFSDSQRARSRREEELELESEFRGSPEGKRPPTAGGKNWWDAEVDGYHQRRGTETGP